MASTSAIATDLVLRTDQPHENRSRRFKSQLWGADYLQEIWANGAAIAMGCGLVRVLAGDFIVRTVTRTAKFTSIEPGTGGEVGGEDGG